jgi:carboxyl-terminal processing protease
MYKQRLGTGLNVARSGAISRHYNKFGIRHLAISLAAIALLAACGGASGPDNDAPGDNNPKGINDQDESQIKQVYAPSAQLANTCVTPASGEKQGTVNDEKSWVRSFVDERYLWYKDVPYVDASKYTSAAAYFEVLKTPAKNSAGKDLDRFHWSESIEETNRYNSGVSLDYGIKWVYNQNSPPRDWVVYDVEPQSPAGKAGIQRGDKLLTIDGLDSKTSAEVGTINSALFPKDKAEHTLELQRGTSSLPPITLKAGQYATTPVRGAKVITDNGNKVAYLYFDSFIAKSQDALITAFSSFQAQGAKELVIDMRYNGGGLLYISSQLAYMIAGPTVSSGKTFNKLVYNDKRSGENYTYDFIPYALNTSYRYDYMRPLPSLNLKRVTLLVDHGTASASEAVINGLMGIDITVNLIGASTYGKPYGFTPQGNCGRIYYAVEFKGENHKGFSAFDAGFAPTCTVKDDLNFQLGDVAEPRLAEALQYLKSGKCTSAPAASIKAMGTPDQASSVVDPTLSRALMIPTKVHP